MRRERVFVLESIREKELERERESSFWENGKREKKIERERESKSE